MSYAEYVQGQIDATTSSLTAAQEAELALMTGGIQSYSIDTGQGRQSVTRANITELRNYIDYLTSRLQYWYIQLNGGGAGYGGPSW